MLNTNWLFIFAGLFAVIIELILGVATGFDFAIFGIALIVGGTAGNITNNSEVSFITAILLIILYIFFGRKALKNKLNINTKNTNVDELIDKTGVCLKKIEPHAPGQIKIKSEIWRAESDEQIEVHEKVKITGVEGVTLKVVKLK